MNFAESTSDAEPGAPDIGTVNNAVDGSCRLQTEVLLAPLALQPDQYLLVGYDLDEPTAIPALEAIDIYVAVDASGAELRGGVGPPVRLPTFGQYGFAVTLDQLGVTRSPMSLGVVVTGVFDPTPDEPGGHTLDTAPDAPPWHRVPVSFTGPAPPPSTQPAPTAKKATTCVVPKVKRLTVRKAKRKLKRAKCKYKVKGRGRVRWTSPKAGTRTRKTVRVRAKRTPRQHR